MKTTFALDPHHSFVIGQNDTPRPAADRPTVDFSIRRTPPLPFASLRGQSGPSTYPPAPPTITGPALLDATFYGPHECEHCGCLIVKQGNLPGGRNDGAEFDYPSGPIYPNTLWVPHVHREPEKHLFEEHQLFGWSLMPSAARAVASMILSAATEARG